MTDEEMSEWAEMLANLCDNRGDVGHMAREVELKCPIEAWVIEQLMTRQTVSQYKISQVFLWSFADGFDGAPIGKSNKSGKTCAKGYALGDLFRQLYP